MCHIYCQSQGKCQYYGKEKRLYFAAKIGSSAILIAMNLDSARVARFFAEISLLQRARSKLVAYKCHIVWRLANGSAVR